MPEILQNKYVQWGIAFVAGMVTERIMFGGDDTPQALPAPAPQIEGKKKKKKKDKDKKDE